MNRTLRDIQSADDIKKSVRERLEAQDRLERALRPWSDMFTNAGNKIGTVGSNAAASILESGPTSFMLESALLGVFPAAISAMTKNTEAIQEDIKERRKQAGGNLENAPINQWHKQMLESPFDPARNAPRKPMGPLP